MDEDFWDKISVDFKQTSYKDKEILKHGNKFYRACNKEYFLPQIEKSQQRENYKTEKHFPKKDNKNAYDASIDLHGLKLDEAENLFYESITFCQARGERVLLVITGRGTPEKPGLIKSNIERWIQHLSKYIISHRFKGKSYKESGAVVIKLRKKPI